MLIRSADKEFIVNTEAIWLESTMCGGVETYYLIVPVDVNGSNMAVGRYPSKGRAIRVLLMIFENAKKNLWTDLSENYIFFDEDN